MDVASVGKAMLDAAKGAAGDTWGKIQHDFASDLDNVLRNAEKIEANLAAGDLNQDEAEVLLRNQSRTLFILSQEAEVDAELVAQNAINSAIDVLWAAVEVAARIG
jgi:hypothetical protein